MAPFEAHFLDIPFPAAPHTLHMLRWGNSGDIVLCVHGLSRNAHDFDYLAAALAAQYQVLCPDMPGRGKSDWLPRTEFYNYQTYVFDLQQMLRTMNITRVHWIGTSMGGILGMMMAGAMPGLIQSLVLNDVGAVVSKKGLQRIMSYAGVRMEFDTRAEAEAEIRTIFVPFGVRDENHWQHIFTHSLHESKGKVRFAYDPAIVGTLPPKEAIMDVNLWPLWEAVKSIPTLLIRGADSDILTKETAQMMQATHPNLTYREIADTGHAPMLMETSQVTMIRDWLATNQ